MTAAPGAPEVRLRVMIVDGESAARQALTRQLGVGNAVEVVGTAINARTALAKLQAYRPDVVVVDLVSGDVDGLGFARELRRNGAAPGLVLLVADETAGDARRIDSALQPCEVLTRPRVLAADANDPMPMRAVLAAAGRKGTRRGKDAPAAATGVPSAGPAPAAPPAIAARTWVAQKAEIVGIGTSTGGPNALAAMLPMLPAEFPLPILIVQHMPAGFTASLAQSLTRICRIPVAEAVDGDRVVAGRILIAPGGQHMRVVERNDGVFVELTEDPPEHSCRPAVDYLFRSLHQVYGGRTIAVVMTGMGEDGFAGSRQLRAAGAWIIAQNEASCTVYGMPRGPIESGITDAVAPLDQIAARICEASPWGVLQ
ncbi:MAG: chemotaxis-specific protein-glutamate methyltransferase CheB [Planctomycetes bacterium]|nr:chemotaxis-specific protein-glutamate methyltransferase CheB [Planctomycetota bacterium]